METVFSPNRVNHQITDVAMLAAFNADNDQHFAWLLDAYAAKQWANSVTPVRASELRYTTLGN